MNISIRSKNMLFFILFSLGGLLGNAPVLRAEAEVNTSQEATEAQFSAEEIVLAQNAIKKLSLNVRNGLKGLLQVLNIGNLNVKNGNYKNVDNKNEFHKNCLELIEFTNYVLTQTPLQIDLQSINQLQFFTTQLSNHFTNAFKTTERLVKLDEFDFKVMITRSSTRSNNFKDMKSFISNLEKVDSENTLLIENLKKTIESFGLSAFNKNYRVFNNWVIQPTIKYNIPEKALVLAASAAGALVVTKFISPDSSIFNDVKVDESSYRSTKTVVSLWNCCIRYLDGNLTADTNSLVNKEGKLSPMGTVDYLSTVAKGSFTISTLAALSIPTLKNKLVSACEWASNKIVNKHYQWLGGSYAKKTQELNDAIITPRKTFDDIVGNDAAKKELQRVIDYLENPESFNANNAIPSRGFLLTGPTGSGKSYLAEAFAGEVKKMFKRTGKDPKKFNFLAVESHWLQNTESLNRLFNIARHCAPCVLWIDELDMYNLNRTGNSALLQQLLVEMSGSFDADPENPIIIMAATNNPQTIDFALKRPGRMETHLEIQLPGFNDRREFFKRKINGLASTYSIDFDRLSYLTEGQTYQMITNIVNATAFSTVVHFKQFDQTLLEENIEKLVHNVETIDCKELPDDEKELIALNQSGHALAMLLLSSKSILDKVNTKPYIIKLPDEPMWNQVVKNKVVKKPQDIKKYGRTYSHRKKDTHGINSAGEQIKQIKIALAGNAAERLVYGDCGNTYKGEFGSDYAYKLALESVSKGINLEDLSDTVKAKYQEKALELVEKCEQEVYELLSTNKENLGKVTSLLLEKQELSRSELCQIIGIVDTEAPVAPAVSQDSIAELP